MRRSLTVLLALAALAAVAVPALAASAVNVPMKLRSVLPKARSKSGIAVRLPSRLNAGVSPSKVSGTLEQASHGQYHLALGAAPGCHEATACFVAAFFGTRGGKISGEQKVTLARGIAGRFTPIHCGASCAAADVQWSQGGVGYVIQFKGTKKQLIALGDSAIRGGAR